MEPRDSPSRQDVLDELRALRIENNAKFGSVEAALERTRAAIEGTHRELAKEIGRVDRDVQVARAEAAKDREADRHRMDGHQRTLYGDDGSGGVVGRVNTHESQLRIMRWLVGVLASVLVIVSADIVVRFIDQFTGGG